MKERKKFPVLAGTIILFLVVILLGYTGRAEAAGKVQLKNTTISVYKTVYTYNGRVQKPAVERQIQGQKAQRKQRLYAGLFQRPEKSRRLHCGSKRKRQLQRNGEKDLPYQSRWHKAGFHAEPVWRHDAEAHLETAVEGGFRLSDPLFDAERF